MAPITTKKTSEAAPPKTISEALLRIVWGSRLRTTLLLMAAAVVGLFGVWSALPETVQDRLVARVEAAWSTEPSPPDPVDGPPGPGPSPGSESVATSTFDVFLKFPSRMQGAEILVDGSEAEALKRTPTTAVVRVPSRPESHLIRLELGARSCETRARIARDGVQVRPCA